METKYYVDANGNYLGGYSGVQPPAGAIEVPYPPNNALDKWNGTSWTPFVTSKADRIQALQDAYDVDRAKLNMAWLSAIIADGPPETARKALISTQMTDLSTQLNNAILAIIMEA